MTESGAGLAVRRLVRLRHRKRHQVHRHDELQQERAGQLPGTCIAARTVSLEIVGFYGAIDDGE